MADLQLDYDTQASYYGVKKANRAGACADGPLGLHGRVGEYDDEYATHEGMSVKATVYSLDNKQLMQHEEKKDVAANDVTAGFKLELGPVMGTNVVLVKLELKNSAGQVVSDNLYWLGATSASYRQLTRLPAETLTTSATWTPGQIKVHMQNTGGAVALANKLTLVNKAGGVRILPAYYSDNYVSLLPGESCEVDIEYPVSAASGEPQVNLRGWTLAPTTVPISRGTEHASANRGRRRLAFRSG